MVRLLECGERDISERFFRGRRDGAFFGSSTQGDFTMFWKLSTLAIVLFAAIGVGLAVAGPAQPGPANI